MKNAWVYQKADDVKRLGADQAPWVVGWYEPDGRRRSKTVGAGHQNKRLAERMAAKLTSELMTGTYEQKTTMLWDDFVTEYSKRILDGKESQTRRLSLEALAQFKRHVKPIRVFSIDTGHVDDFIARRRKDPGKKKGSTVSPATLNKDLRHIKAALNVAVDWGYLKDLPRFRMDRVPKKLVRYTTPEHFAEIYTACSAATMPKEMPFPPADWWRALLTFAYMTGWRIGDLLALRRDNLDMANGYAISCYDDAKGDRDDRVKLHPSILEHLELIKCFDPMVFPWHHDRRTLDAEFDRIQVHAGIHLHCRGKHEHTPACHLYGFHDLRRSFATMNAARLTPDTLQALMRHKSYLTTQVYINITRHTDEAVDSLHVPDILRKKDPPSQQQA